jgi:hypothetical protein
MSTYTPIASQTLASAAASVTFSSIPQGYTDLVLIGNPKLSASLDYKWYVNGDNTSGLYSQTRLVGNGSTATSGRTTGANFLYLDFTAPASSSVQTFIMNFQNYANTNTFKTVLVRYNDAGTETAARVNLWRNTNAITSLTISTDSSTFAAGSTFSIYGIQVGDKAQKAQGGNIVTTDGTYIYHTFTTSGSFTTNEALTADYLVVAGGAGGGADSAGGGGAGGLRSTVTATGGGGSLESALSLSAGKSYPVIVGAGGAGGPATGNAGTAGSNSVFSTITSTGGGSGGGRNIDNATTGGSGGGGAGDSNSTTRTGKSGTANQGYAGGNGYASGSAIAGGGGGGAGAVGSAGASNGTGGNGGNGVAVAISGSSVTYAGGGGGGEGSTSNSGGSGGSGGGGAGASSGTGGSEGFAGSVNTGGGGGGGGRLSAPGSGGAGGSGVVIIRYAV